MIEKEEDMKKTMQRENEQLKGYYNYNEKWLTVIKVSVVWVLSYVIITIQ